MLDAQRLPLVQSYLARPNRDLATTEELSAWEQFHRMCLAVILVSIRRVAPQERCRRTLPRMC